MVMPGTTFAAHSLAASSALTPALPASILLCTSSATLQAPITVPFASSRSRAISSTRSTPGFGCQERILDRRRLGLRIEDLERLPDLVFSPHLAAERDRERTVAQDDDRGRARSVRRQERVCEGKREAGVGVVGVHLGDDVPSALPASPAHRRALPRILRAPGSSPIPRAPSRQRSGRRNLCGASYRLCSAEKIKGIEGQPVLITRGKFSLEF